jgi:hypothetical protein
LVSWVGAISPLHYPENQTIDLEDLRGYDSCFFLAPHNRVVAVCIVLQLLVAEPTARLYYLG